MYKISSILHSIHGIFCVANIFSCSFQYSFRFHLMRSSWSVLSIEWMKKLSPEILARFNGNEIEMCICNSIISFTKLFRPCCLGVRIDCASFILSPLSNSSIADCIICWRLTFNLPFFYYAICDWLKIDCVFETANTLKKKKIKPNRSQFEIITAMMMFFFVKHIFDILHVTKPHRFSFTCWKNRIINCRTEEKKFLCFVFAFFFAFSLKVNYNVDRRYDSMLTYIQISDDMTEKK